MTAYVNEAGNDMKNSWHLSTLQWYVVSTENVCSYNWHCTIFIAVQFMTVYVWALYKWHKLYINSSYIFEKYSKIVVFLNSNIHKIAWVSLFKLYYCMLLNHAYLFPPFIPIFPHLKFVKIRIPFWNFVSSWAQEIIY